MTENWERIRMFVDTTPKFESEASPFDPSIEYLSYRAQRNSDGKILKFQTEASQEFKIPYRGADLAAEIEGMLRADPEGRVSTKDIRTIQLLWWVDCVDKDRIEQAQKQFNESDRSVANKLKSIAKSNPAAFAKAGYQKIDEASH